VHQLEIKVLDVLIYLIPNTWCLTWVWNFVSPQGGKKTS